VDQYLELRESALAGSTVTGGGNPVTSAGQAPSASGTGASEAEKRDARKALNRIERQIKKLDQQEKKLHDEMVKSTEKSDFDALAEQNRQLKDLADEKDALELEWLESSELLGD
jgi:small-conductance mechanosensitive channel